MNATSMTRAEGTTGAVIGDPFEFQETRLWDRARSNLLLLYGGRRGGRSPGQATVSNNGSGLFGNVDLKI
jgi:hypothetical protein